MRNSFVVVVIWAGAAFAGAAHASGPSITMLEPANSAIGLLFDHVPLDRQTPTQRIRVRNDGDPARDVSYISGPFVIVASGGGFAHGQEKFWDVACLPFGQLPISSGTLYIDLCDSSCDVETVRPVFLQCTGGLLDAPFNVFTPSTYGYEPSHEIMPLSNTGQSPVTVTGFTSSNPAVSSAFTSGTLPRTLAPGETADVTVTFDASVPGADATIKVLAGVDVAARAEVHAFTLPSIAPSQQDLGLIPEGAVYRLPITVRNSFPTARTITMVTADLPDYSVAGLAGTTLAPRQVARGMMTFTATTQGARNGQLTVAFDTGPSETARLFVTVVPPTFKMFTLDATPNDGLLDFGTRELGSAPIERTIVIVNHDGVERSIFSCFAGGAPFQLVGACPASLPAHGQVSLTVRFTSNSVGDPVGAAGLALIPFALIESGLTAHVPPKGAAFSDSKLEPADVTSSDDDGQYAGGCSAGSSAGGALSIVLLAFLRRHRRARDRRASAPMTTIFMRRHCGQYRSVRSSWVSNRS